jgi:hypothetical protein
METHGKSESLDLWRLIELLDKKRKHLRISLREKQVKMQLRNRPFGCAPHHFFADWDRICMNDEILIPLRLKIWYKVFKCTESFV